jgi:predicted dehydrogenase
MSYNIENYGNSYEILTNIGKIDLQKKSVLIIGAGWMSRQYAIALSQMKIKDVTIVSRNKDKVTQLANEFNFTSICGQADDIFPNLPLMDLVIVATSVNSLFSITKFAIKNGQTNILIEKPGSLYRDEILNLNKISKNSRIRIAYNRLTYPNLHKLKLLVSQEGGITSCNFNFTERIDSIDFKKEITEVYTRWGISNTLHIISMVLDLIGFPKEYLFYQSGKLDWHPTGSIFVGSGLTEKNIPFSYHADWGSSGRWGIEVMTKENAYRLISLEELYVCHKNSFEWIKVPFDVSFPKVKQGVAEELCIMLEPNLENIVPLTTLEKASKFNEVAEKILGYDKT